MPNGRKTCVGALIFSILALTLLAAFKTLAVPEFHNDAQYYTQSALLWPSGQVSFAGTLVSDRHLTIWFYHLFLAHVGESLDSLSLALSLLYLLNGLAIVGICFSLVAQPLLAGALSLAMNLVYFGLRMWDIPGSEPTYTMANSLLVLVWIRVVLAADRPSRFRLLVPFLGACIGLLSAFRPGNILFLVGVLLGLVALELTVAAERPRRALNALLAGSLLVVGFGVGGAAAELVWKTWVPAERPPTYFYAHVLARPIYESGLRENGPVTARTLDEMGAPAGAKIDYWKTLAFTYTQHGAEASDRTLRDIGLEALKARPSQAVAGTASSFRSYFWIPAPRLEVTTDSTEMHWNKTSRALGIIDHMRVQSSARFGGDVFTSTQRLAEQKLPWLTSFRANLPSTRFHLQLPGWLLLGIPVTLAYLGLRRRWRVLIAWLPFCCLALGVLLVTSFSQPLTARYAEPFLPLALLMGVTSLALQAKASESNSDATD